MSYATIATIQSDFHLHRRVTACVAAEKINAPDYEAWANEHRWQLATQPGWATAWESAVEVQVENPGADPGVITDAMILAAVQSLAA